MYNYAIALEAYPINYYGNCKYKKHHYIVLLTCYSCLHVIEVEVQQTPLMMAFIIKDRSTIHPDSKHSRRLKIQEDLLYQRDCAQLLASTQLFTRHLPSL